MTSARPLNKGVIWLAARGERRVKFSASLMVSTPQTRVNPQNPLRPPNGGHGTYRHHADMQNSLGLRSTHPIVAGREPTRRSRLWFQRLASVAAAGAVVAGSLVPAASASAQWGAPAPRQYCSSSVGCYVDPATGRAVYTTVGPVLTSRERALLGQCQMRMAGSGFGVAGAIAGRNWLAFLGATFNGGAALVGPCKDLWNSTARFRRS